MLRFQRVLIRGRWVQTRLLSLNASTVGGVLRYVSETCVQDRKLLFRPFKLSKSHLDGRASRPVGRVELAPRKNVFPVAYTVLWVRMPVYMCSGLRLKETRRGAALSMFCISFLFKTHTQAKTKHFKYWCGSCDAFGAVGVSRFYVRQLQPIAKRTFSTPIRNIPDHITGKLPPEPQKTLHNR